MSFGTFLGGMANVGAGMVDGAKDMSQLESQRQQQLKDAAVLRDQQRAETYNAEMNRQMLARMQQANGDLQRTIRGEGPDDYSSPQDAKPADIQGPPSDLKPKDTSDGYSPVSREARGVVAPKPGTQYDAGIALHQKALEANSAALKALQSKYVNRENAPGATVDDGYGGVYTPSGGKENFFPKMWTPEDSAESTRLSKLVSEAQQGVSKFQAMKDADAKKAAAPKTQTPAPTPAAATGASLNVRNNNPGNIMGNGQYNTYESPEAGFAAMARQLQVYQNRDGLNTVAGIISKWSPADDGKTAALKGNNPSAAAANVAKMMGVDPNAQLNLNDPNTLGKLMVAMANQEGKNNFTQDHVLGGLKLASQGAVSPTGQTPQGNATPGQPTTYPTQQAAQAPQPTQYDVSGMQGIRGSGATDGSMDAIQNAYRLAQMQYNAAIKSGRSDMAQQAMVALQDIQIRHQDTQLRNLVMPASAGDPKAVNALAGAFSQLVMGGEPVYIRPTGNGQFAMLNARGTVMKRGDLGTLATVMHGATSKALGDAAAANSALRASEFAKANGRSQGELEAKLSEEDRKGAWDRVRAEQYGQNSIDLQRLKGTQEFNQMLQEHRIKADDVTGASYSPDSGRILLRTNRGVQEMAIPQQLKGTQVKTEVAPTQVYQAPNTNFYTTGGTAGGLPISGNGRG